MAYAHPRSDAGASRRWRADARQPCRRRAADCCPANPWGAYFPTLHALAQLTPANLPVYLRQFTAVEDPRCRQVWEQLSPRERDVLCAFAQGLRPDQVAERLSISLSTGNTHKTNILAECRIA
ncbi:helix-turn-helix transcriptional regulator [Chloroflexus sp.]|uniref:helix-turn-helix transcriptional regulator n=1 Tax=Chloroflexus sp. TaxID=1904827 RepID=UPI002ACD957D|nr:helix-turn-helix transcriptional regulator [Chloroflexus sp.]